MGRNSKRNGRSKKIKRNGYAKWRSCRQADYICHTTGLAVFYSSFLTPQMLPWLAGLAGDRALAAVGSCVALVGIFVNLLVGMSVGPNAALATLIGQKKRERISGMLHTILTFGVILGFLLMGIGMLCAKVVLEASGTPQSVMSEALLYIRIYFISLPFMTIYNFGSAILRSYGDSKRPMYYLLTSGIVNVILI